MSKHCFCGKWITTEELYNLKSVDVFHRQLEKKEIKSVAPQNLHILFRKSFVAEKNKKTYIYISADDFYKLYINGKFVCMGPAPGYPFHYYYNKVNISDYIQNGDNVIAVHTYYQGLINRVWVSGDNRHGLICDIEQDGKNILASDEDFVYSYHKGFSSMGKFGYDTQFAERYTSGTESENFQMPNYDAKNWKNANKKQFVDYELFEQPTKMLEFETIAPIFQKRDNGGITLDFGSNYVGYLNLFAKGNKGDTVELLFGQELNEDGSVRFNLRANCNYREEWILSGGDDELNEYDYKSFRYVRINAQENIKIANISMTVRHYPFELVACPNTENEKLLSVWNLCVHTLKYGAQEVIQDCMEREKGNYLGDGCYTALAHMILTKDTSLMKKLIDDSLRSSFINRGLMTCAACSFMQEIAEYPLFIYYTLYSYYRLTGDSEYLKEKYDTLCDILNFYKESYMSENGLLSNLDKWCVVEWPKNFRDGYDADIEEGKICTDVHNAINAHYIGAVKYLNKIAAVLDYKPYCDEKPLIKAYTDAFYDKEKKLFKDNANSSHISVVSNAFALMYELFPNEETKNNIINFIEQKGITSVNFFAGFAMLDGLKKVGREDVMHKLLADENAWLGMLREGATTTFESWGKNSKQNTSLFHLTLSFAVIFLTDWEQYEL